VTKVTESALLYALLRTPKDRKPRDSGKTVFLETLRRPQSLFKTVTFVTGRLDPLLCKGLSGDRVVTKPL
jgi:hypothetical protein